MNDFCITTDSVVLTNNIDILLQEIDTLFDTNNGDLFGDPNHATDFERFLWNTNVSTTQIANYVLGVITEKCDTFDYQIDVEVNALKGTDNDIILVEIKIENEHYEAQRIYKIG